METLGSRLRKLRLQQGYTQKHVADVLNISEGSYSNYETDKRQPNYDMLRRIMDLYNVSAEYIFGQVEYPFVPSPFEEEEEDMIMYRLIPEPSHSFIRDIIIHEYKRNKKEDA